MLKDSISNWLNGIQNFIVGRALYMQIGFDDKIKQQLMSGENACNRKVLRDSLENLLLDKPHQSSAVNLHFGEMPPIEETVVKSLRHKWLPLFSKMNYLRGQLDLYQAHNAAHAVAAREPIAFEILDLEDQCEAIWAKRDYYLKHGTLPEVDEREFIIPTDPKELAKLLQNIPRNIRRNRLKMQQPGAKALYAHLYNRYKGLYKQITGNEYVEKD